MKHHSFGNRSLTRLNTCHPDLIKIMMLALTFSPCDFSITYGHRTIDEQKKLFAKGRTTPGSIVTNCDGVRKKSDHNEFPSRVVDVHAYIPTNKKLAYDHRTLSVIAGCVFAACAVLVDQKEIHPKSFIRWGGDWDRDGVIVHDQKLVDLPHFGVHIK
jgi:peptidoglycan L-alanyl-D-glutamate endopeptidase CwlK